MDIAVANTLQVGVDEPRSVLVSIILPAYNEAVALPVVLDELCKTTDSRYEIIVVDDGSTDCTAEVAKQYPCRVIHHTTNLGKGAAMKTGVRFAKGQFVVFMDADGTYPVLAIPCLVKLLETNDLVRCVRKNGRDKIPRINQIGNRLFDILLAAILRLPGDDQLSGLYGMRREQLLSMNIDSDGFDIESEINFKSQARRLSVATFPIDYASSAGREKLRPFRDGWRSCAEYWR
jgi:glycosyltransferase involved in cell wall biosynthesis